MSNFVNMQNSGGIFRSRRLGLRRWFSRTANDKNSEPEVDDERVFTVVLEGDDDLGSGSANSAELVDILNSGQDAFVAAIDVESSGLAFVSGAELTVDLEVTVGYTVSVP
ncbi:MAG: hypothetical protein ACLFNQ_12360 [Spirochaetaceae bacterium]